MVFRLYVRCDGAAFSDDGYGRPADRDIQRDAEIARILRVVADRITLGGAPSHYLTILDVNGNDVGRYALKGDE